MNRKKFIDCYSEKAKVYLNDSSLKDNSKKIIVALHEKFINDEGTASKYN